MPNQKVEQSVDRILVTLDSLIDTRLGVIAQAFPDKVEKVLTRNYYDRIQDRFNGIDPEVYADLWKKRDVETLKKSMMTNMTLLLGSFIKSATNEVLGGNPPNALIFDINIHPYQLDEDERNDLLGVLEVHVGDAVEYNIISVPDEFLTPQHCKATYQVMVLYDFANWMRMHSGVFKEFRMPDVTIYAPQLLEKLPTPAENQEMIDAKLDPFEASRLAASPAFAIRFLTMDMYSIRDPVKDVKRFQMHHSNG